MFDSFWIYYLPVIYNLIFSLWVKWGCITDFKLGYGHILIFTAISLVPILGLVLSVTITILYLGARCEKDIILKNNKFNKIFFNN